MTALPTVIILATVALVCVVAWTQAAIWRRLDRIEQIQRADYNALHADTTLLRGQIARTLDANADPTQGGTPPLRELPKGTAMTEPKTYRKKPVEVRAMHLVGTAGDTAQVTGWMNREGYPWLVGDATQPDTLRDPQDLDLPYDRTPTRGIYIDPANGNLLIRTLEGDMHATYGDYIVQGVAGEFYPCKPDIFHQTYEEATND